jgi:hypothetical protein
MTHFHDDVIVIESDSSHLDWRKKRCSRRDCIKRLGEIKPSTRSPKVHAFPLQFIFVPGDLIMASLSVT